jgi:phenylpropionate dioxygenase-like ring-hydroxylating dioxygenase large terminal subunit
VNNSRNSFEVKPSYYFDEAEFLIEKNTILEKYWIFICPSSLISKPKSYFVFKALEKNIVFRRSEDGSLAVFDNICKHRGHQIYTDVTGVSDIRCSYHGWLYSDDLSLKKLPWNEKCYHIQEEKILLNRFNHIKEVNGLIWAFFGSNVEQAKFPADLLEKDLTQFSTLYSSSIALINGKRNFHWRLIFENLYDRVHPVFLHSNSLNKVVDLDFDEYPNNFDLLDIEGFYLANLSQSGKRKDFKELQINANNLPEGAYINGHIFPFLHFFTPDGGNIFCFESYLPISTKETQLFIFWIVSKNIPKSSHVLTLQRYIEGGSIVLEEDFQAVESISRAEIKGATFNYGAHEKSFFGLKKLSEN